MTINLTLRRGCVKMKLVEFVTFKLIVDVFLINLGLVGHCFSIKV